MYFEAIATKARTATMKKSEKEAIGYAMKKRIPAVIEFDSTFHFTEKILAKTQFKKKQTTYKVKKEIIRLNPP